MLKAVMILVLMALAPLLEPTLSYVNLNRTNFPSDFIFGSSSSAYQTEGAWNESGKGPSVWDYFTHKYPDRIVNGGNGDVAIDFYHRYVDDVQIMKDVGLDAFRFSISWARLLPYGKRCKGVNQDGVDFYNNLINELLKRDIEPWVTIYHWDAPLALEDEYGGFRSKRIVKDYRDFARLCFQLFGDRVKQWMTINEPWTMSKFGYEDGSIAPGRCSKCLSTVCQDGDSSTEPYLVTHHMLLAHAAAVHEYRNNFKARQMGNIGLCLNSHWYVAVNESRIAKEAVDRTIDWNFGWHVNPITYGKYPDSMRQSLGSRLPEFTEEEQHMLIRSFDFLGLNYYGAVYAIPKSSVNDKSCLKYSEDYNVTLNVTIYGGNPARLLDLNGPYPYAIYPKGLRYLLNYTMNKYQNPIIYITENGVSDYGIHDDIRIEFYRTHIAEVHKSISFDGVTVKGFFAWTLMDNMEWAHGYEPRMGLIYIDYEHNLTRIYKDSAQWFRSFLIKRAPIIKLNDQGGTKACNE